MENTTSPEYTAFVESAISAGITQGVKQYLGKLEQDLEQDIVTEQVQSVGAEQYITNLIHTS